tara:strand:+ start:4100 stop:4582 length:483 start_codon:yes stop_codon:yes gene_type:complete
MKAGLIFFDNKYESANGTFRGLIGFTSILILYKCLNAIDTDLFKIDYRIVFTALLLCCCLGVIIPENEKSSIILGGLVFFVFFSLISIYNTFSNTIDYLKFITAGIIIGCITNYIIWKLYWTTQLRINGTPSKYVLWNIINIAVLIFVLKYYPSLQVAMI